MDSESTIQIRKTRIFIDNGRKTMKPRRGISAYIAVLLLLALAMSAGAVIYSVTMGEIGRLGPQTSGSRGTISLDTASINQNELTAYIRNLGDSSIEIDKVYVEGAGYSIEINGPGVGDDVIQASEMGNITVVIPGGFIDGKNYEFKVFTKDNLQLSFTERAAHITQIITPPSINDFRYIDTDTSNVDGISDLGSLINFANMQTIPDATYGTLSESVLVGPSYYDYIDTGGSNVDGVPDKGTHSNFDNLKALDSIMNTLSEEDTGTPETGFRVYHDSFEFASGTSTVQSIGATVDTAHSFLIVYTAGTSAPREPDEGSCMGYISSPTQVTFERQVSSAGLYVSWFVVECLDDEFTVRGRDSITLNTGVQTNTASVSGVIDQSQCTIMYGGHKGEGGSNYDWEDTFCNVHLTAVDTVTAQRHSGSTGTRTNVRFEVVEWSNDYNIFTGEATVSSTSVTDMISGGGNPYDPTVDLSRSIMFANWWAEQNGIQQVQIYYSITDTNEVTLGQYSGGRNPLVRWYVVEFPATKVPGIQRYAYNWNPTTAPGNTRSNAMTAVNTSRTFIRMSSSTSGTGTAFLRDFNLPRLDSATAWSETQYNPATSNVDQHETRASVIELPYSPAVVNYKLNLEANFTSVTDYDVTELCIRAGTLGSEDINLSVWNQTLGDWNTLAADLSADGWNNYTITGFVDTNVTIRFMGGTETTDTTQDNWQIDAVLLHQYDQSYRLDQETQWSDCNSSLPYAEVCIYTGVLDAEVMRVDIWDKTLGSWDVFIPSLSADSWNNVTVKSYLIDDNEVTLRFIDTATSSDTTQDICLIDTLLIHSWN